MGAAQITDPKGVISNIPQGTVSEESMVTMPTEELDQKQQHNINYHNFYQALKKELNLLHGHLLLLEKLQPSCKVEGWVHLVWLHQL